MKAYRYVDVVYAGMCDEYDNVSPGSVELQLREFDVIKVTKKGYWIREFFRPNRFCLLKARKKYACLTKEEARVSYKARKRRQIAILSSQLKRAKFALNLADYKLT